MKKLRFISIVLVALTISASSFGSILPVEDIKTAESAFIFAESMDPFDGEIFKTEIKDLSSSEKVKLIRMSIENIEQAELLGSGNPTIGYYILAVLLPPAAVGIYTDWRMPTTLYSVAWTILGWVPGVIHAFIILGR